MSDLSNQIVHFFNLCLADATGADDDDADEEETEASVGGQVSRRSTSKSEERALS